MGVEKVNERAFNACLLFIPNLGLSGGVAYTTKDENIEAQEDAEYKTWRGERFIPDKKEYMDARALKEKVRRRFQAIGTSIKAGVIVTLDRRAELGEAIEYTRSELDAFNQSAVYSRFWFYPIQIVIDSSNSDVLKAVTVEMKDLLASIEGALSNNDYKAVRKLLKGVKTGNFVKIFGGEARSATEGAFEAIRKRTNDLAAAERGEEMVAETEDRNTLDLIREARETLSEAMFIEVFTEVPEVTNVDVESASEIETTGGAFM